MVPFLADLATADPAALARRYTELARQAAAQLGPGAAPPEATRLADLRYRGQSFELTVAVDGPSPEHERAADAGGEPAGWSRAASGAAPDLAALGGRFHREHERRYGYRMDDEPVELVNLRLVATRPGSRPVLREDPAAGGGRSRYPPGQLRRRMAGGGGVPAGLARCGQHGARTGSRGVRRVYVRAAPRLDRHRRRCRHAAAHPARRESGVTAGRTADRTGAGRGRLDPITLSVLTSALSGVAEEMGTALVRSAYSSNIKERRDCSAALFDAARPDGGPGRAHSRAPRGDARGGGRGDGARSGARRRVRRSTTRSPAAPTCPTSRWCRRLGTDERDLRLRGHPGAPLGRRRHAAGSMPAGSRDIWSGGPGHPAGTARARRRLRSGRARADPGQHRTPGLRRGDFRAQIAANRLAQDRLADLMARRGDATVLAAFDEVLAYAERRTREVVQALPDGEYVASERRSRATA